MQQNIDKIMQRGTNLDYLEDRSEVLSSNANEFRIGARRVSRKMWWQNMKINIIIGSVILIVIIIIIGRCPGSSSVVTLIARFLLQWLPLPSDMTHPYAFNLTILAVIVGLQQFVNNCKLFCYFCTVFIFSMPCCEL